jgi:hypothetical protein
MDVKLVFVPPGGGKAVYSLDFDVPAIPRPGDYITVMRPNQTGTEDFVVRRGWWVFQHREARTIQNSQDVVRGSTQSVAVECEFARGHYSSEDHQKACDAYEKRGGTVSEFDASLY